MSTLERAVEIAARAHAGQVDKAGAPYLLHPLRLMMRMPDEPARIVAVLHDVVEDSDVTFDDLRERGFTDDVLEALASVTKQPDELYQAFCRRAASNPIGRRVKLADIEDNLDLTRIEELTDRDLDRVRKYHEARRVLITATEEAR